MLNICIHLCMHFILYTLYALLCLSIYLSIYLSIDLSLYIYKNILYIYIYIYISYIFLYVYIHHWQIFWSSYRTLAWVGFEPPTTEFCSNALTDWAMRPWVQLALRATFLQLLQFYQLFSVTFHFDCLISSVATFILIEVFCR